MTRIPALAVAGVLACLIASAAAQTNTHPAVLRAQVEARLKQIVDRIDGVMGYAVVDLTTGERFGFRDSEIFPTASTIKLAILYELFNQADAGTIKLDEPRPIPEAARVGGSGLLYQLTTARLSLRDYATLIILISDNTATNVIIDTLGLDKIQARIDGLGFTKTKLRRRMMDTAAARRGDENVSSPAEVARLLELFHKGEGVGREQERRARHPDEAEDHDVHAHVAVRGARREQAWRTRCGRRRRRPGPAGQAAVHRGVHVHVSAGRVGGRASGRRGLPRRVRLL